MSSANTATSDAGHPRPVLGGIDCDGIRRSASPRELPPRDDRPKRAPTLTCRIWPVICPASGDAKYSIALATPQVLAPHIQTERWQRDCAAATHLCASGEARQEPPGPRPVPMARPRSHLVRLSPCGSWACRAYTTRDFMGIGACVHAHRCQTWQLIGRFGAPLLVQLACQARLTRCPSLDRMPATARYRWPACRRGPPAAIRAG